MSLSLPTQAGDILFGYRTPQLSGELDADGKMLLAKELGMAVVEPQMNQREIPDITHAKELKSAADEHGIRIPSFGSNIDVWNSSTLTAECDEAAAVAEVFTANTVFIRIMSPPLEWSQDQAWQHLQQYVPQIAVPLQQAGSHLLIEADGGTFIHTHERLRRMLDLIPEVWANYDACNLYIGGSDPLHALHDLGPSIKSGHIKDGFFKGKHSREVPVGTGEVDWAQLIQALRDSDLTVPFFIEHCKSSEEVRQATAQLHTWLQAVQAAH